MSRKIFICYRRDDSGMAGRIGDSLAVEFGDDGIFLDTDKLTLGRRFDSELLSTLSESDVFLAVIGRNWLQILQQRQQSGQVDYVVEEIKEALKLKLSVIPLLVDGAVLPDESQLSIEIGNAMRWHGHSVRHESFHPDIRELIQAIHKIRGTGKQSGKIKNLVMLTACICIAAVGGAWWIVQSEPEISGNSNALVVNDGGSESPEKDDSENLASAGINTSGNSDTTGTTANVSKDNPAKETAGSNDDSTGKNIEVPLAGSNGVQSGQHQKVKAPRVADTNQNDAKDVKKELTGVAVGGGEEYRKELEVLEEVTTIEKDEPDVLPTRIENDPLNETVKPQVRKKSEVSGANKGWNKDFTIFPTETFELCGYTSFTISVSGGGEVLLLKSEDRNIPGSNFRGIDWRIKSETVQKLVDGCNVLINYGNTDGIERIRIRENGE